MKLRHLIADRRQVLASVLLGWESLWPEMGWVFGLLAIFALLAIFDVLPALGGTLHFAVLAVFGLGLAGLAIKMVLRFRLPDASAVRHRLEADSGLKHRPLQTLNDRQAANSSDPLTIAFWAVHQRRMRHVAAEIGWAKPRDMLLETDPLGLRAILVIGLFIGIAVAGGDFWPRFGRALTPQFGQESEIASGYDLWLTPPEYTGLAPIYLGSDQPGVAGDTPLAVPAGSTILAQVHGGDAVPTLTLDDQATPFGPADHGQYAVTAKLTNSHHLVVSQARRTIVDREIKPILDQPPSASWAGPVQISAKGAMRLSYTAKDDYGLDGLTLRVTKADSNEAPLEIELPFAPKTKDIKASVYQDLTGNPWAGMPVDLTIIARDAVGQTGATEKLRMTLPERIFTNPVAEEIIADRHRLMKDPNSELPVADDLTTLAEHPDEFGGDLRVFMGLRAATARLVADRDTQAVTSVEELLWDVALRVEDGQTPEAQKALREAQQALRDALDRNAPNAEIEALTRNLQQAIQRYLSAMAEQAQKSGDTPQTGQSGGTPITEQDIQRMLQQAQDLAKTGARDAAKEALSRLQDLLESLKMGGQGKGQGNGPARQALQALQNLSHQQQQILDRSYQAARKGGGKSPGNEDGDAAGLANAQDALRRQLNDIKQSMGPNGSQSLSRAERAMQSAADSLRQSEPTEALGAQGEVLRQLQQAKKELAQQMRDEEGDDPSQQAEGDPFGRTGGSGLESDETKLPAASDVQRSREILDELRKRASERYRPKNERDYLDRLLERF